MYTWVRVTYPSKFHVLQNILSNAKKFNKSISVFFHDKNMKITDSGEFNLIKYPDKIFGAMKTVKASRIAVDNGNCEFNVNLGF